MNDVSIAPASAAREMPPLPDAMKHLERDRRGYPTPFIVARGNDGTPDFRINDLARVDRCLIEGLCAISGLPLADDDVWLVGGPKAAYDPRGAYLDPPARKECLVWALQVCPFLVARRYLMKNAPARFTPPAGMSIMTNNSADPAAPALFVLARTNGIALDHSPDGQIVMLPNRPWLEVEHWQGGRLIEVRRRAQTLKELRAWKAVCTANIPIPDRKRNRGEGPKIFPWSDGRGS
ncbi:MAG: hypothetical protein KJS79_03640 [Rhodospirillales bacterium]|nr:hypothetical protein [Rhodospirillales bacterium]